MLNGLMCTVHKHGATCAIDVLLEAAYFGIYSVDKSIFQVKSVAQDLSFHLNNFCKLRDHRQSTVCTMREDVWEWLLANHEKAFCPKGTSSAECLVGFIALSSELNARIGFKSTCLLHPIMPVVTLTTKSVVEGNGIFEQSMEIEVGHIERQWSKKCRACDGTKETMVAGDFFITELGVADWKNKCRPALTISEVSNMFGASYELIAAVIVQPRHFRCITKIGQLFVRLDGLHPVSESYNTFTGAVYRDPGLTSAHHVTCEAHDGIHLLVFTKLKRDNSQNTTSSVTPDSHLTCSDTEKMEDTPKRGKDKIPCTHSKTLKKTKRTKPVNPESPKPIYTSTPKAKHETKNESATMKKSKGRAESQDKTSTPPPTKLHTGRVKVGEKTSHSSCRMMLCTCHVWICLT